ncbi:MAG: phosphoribosyltransferase family protein [Burkholderiaceae bacterium]
MNLATKNMPTKPRSLILLHRLRRLLIAAADFTLPQYCVTCRNPVAAGDHVAPGRWLADRSHADGLFAAWPFAICQWCRAALPGVKTGVKTGANQHRCPVCGLPGSHRQICHFCREQPPAFSATVVLADYAPPLNHWIHHFKYRQRVDLGRAFGQLLAAQLLDSLPTPAWPESIVAIALSPTRMRHRGYNQAIVLARDLSKRLKIKADFTALHLAGNPVALDGKSTQTRRSRADRLSSLAGRFSATQAVAGKRVLLVDDVMTTGATARAAASALIQAGATRVTNAVIARTPSAAWTSAPDESIHTVSQ